MEAKLSPRLGIVILLVAASCFAANHVCARVAFDHGASVAAAVMARAAVTAIVLLAFLRLQGVAFAVPRALRARLAIAGLLLVVQSYCIYSALTLIPVALALLVFQTSTMLYLLLAWSMGREKPSVAALLPMLLALAGLALALDLRPAQFTLRWQEMGVGVGLSFISAVSSALIYYSNAYALKEVDGRLRTLVMTGVVALVALFGGVATDALAAPRDGTGWFAITLLTVFYCIAITTIFVVVPRVAPASTAALNFEPIALLGLGWVVLGQAVTPLQVVGAFITVGAIAWLGMAKK